MTHSNTSDQAGHPLEREPLARPPLEREPLARPPLEREPLARPPLERGRPARPRGAEIRAIGTIAKGEDGWHMRGYLPHWDGPSATQAVTFRLADSLPAALLAAWWDAASHLPQREATAETRRRVDSYLDKGDGSAWLRDPRVAHVVRYALFHFDGIRYRLHAWVIMPNHVHVLLTPAPDHELSSIVHSWKSYTAKEANRILGRTGAFWQPDYFDRYIRDERHFAAVVSYIEENPVKAGLCATSEEWPFSSKRDRHGERE